MTNCDFCGDEFSDKVDLRVHWGEEHEDELNSHQKDQYKKAVKKKEKRKQQRKQKMAQRRKKVAVYGLGAIAAAFLFYFMYSSLTFTTYATSTDGSGTEFDLSEEPMIGSEDAPVTVVEFGDYKCPVCKQFHNQVYDRPNTDEDLKGQYIDTGKVKFYFMNFPFLGPDSYTAAQATECVLDQSEEQFWNMQDAIYENQGSEAEQWATESFLMQLARDHTEGLDYDQLQSCISSGQKAGEVSDDKAVGNAAGVQGTPTVYVNGRQVARWSYDNLAAAIDGQLN